MPALYALCKIGFSKMAVAKTKLSNAQPTIALALGGGGARGLAHIHALLALDDLGIKPVAISGTSIGAIIGVGYAAGMDAQDILDFMVKSLGNRGELLARLWKLRPKGLGGVQIRFNGPGRVDLESVLKVFLPEKLPQNFEELKIPLTVIATDYYAQKPAVFTTGPLLPALAGSAAIPAFFRPIMHQGRVLIDGGIANPVPFDVLKGKADIVLAIDVVGGPSGPANILPSPVDALFGASQLMMQTIIAEKLRHGAPDIFLRPKVDSWRVMDFLKIKEILDQTKAFRDEVKHAVDAEISRRIKA
jgi:NTE family protein